MSRKVVYQLIDDLDQSVIAEGEGETIEFAVNGRDYVIDLSPAHAKQFHDELGKWISAAHDRGEAADVGAPSPEERTAIRAWAREQGIALGSRGQIPREIVAQYRTSRR